MARSIFSRRFSTVCLLASALLSTWATGCGDDDDDGGPKAGSAGGAGASGSGGGGSAGAAGAGSGGAGGGGGQLVSVYGYDGARAGVDVLVHDAQGALLARAKTDEKGKATVAPPADGSITIVHEEIGSNPEGAFAKRVATYYGYDGTFELRHFVFDDGRPGAGGAGGAGGSGGGAAGAGGAAGGGIPAPTSMRVQVTPSSPVATATSYAVVLRCDNEQEAVAAGATFDRPDYDACGDSTYDVLVLALDAGGEPVAYGTVLDAPLQVGSEAKHAVVADKTDLAKRQYAIQNAPPGAELGWFYLRGGRGDPEASNPDLLAFYTENADLTGSIWMPPNLFTHWSVSQYVSGSDDPNGVSRYLGYDNDIEGPPADVIWSASTTALVDLIKPEAPTDPARPAVTWQLSPQGDVGETLSFDAEWTSGATTALTWTIDMPPVRAATVRMVQLPDDLAAYRGNPALSFDNSSVYLRNYIGVEGWLSYQRDGFGDEYHDSAAVYYPPSEPGARARPGHRAPTLTELRRRHQPAPSGRAPSRSARHAR